MGLPEALQPWPVSQDVFVGEGCDFECAESKLAFKMITKCAAVNPAADNDVRENGTIKKVVNLARTVRAQDRAEKVSTGTLSIEKNNSISS